jgi:hypothetical protein
MSFEGYSQRASYSKKRERAWLSNRNLLPDSYLCQKHIHGKILGKIKIYSINRQMRKSRVKLTKARCARSWAWLRVSADESSNQFSSDFEANHRIGI